MIRSFAITETLPEDKRGRRWAHATAAIQPPRVLEFTPGLNILWAPNGAGKTTILRILATLFHAEQTGSTHITRHSMQQVYDMLTPIAEAKGGWSQSDRASAMKAFRVDHDGQAVSFFDPAHVDGMHDHFYDFDDDFVNFKEVGRLKHGSAGERTLLRIEKHFGEAPTIKVKHATQTFYIAAFGPVVDAFLKGSGKKGPPTVLMDEPCRHLDIPQQAALWKRIGELSKTRQVIAAAHSPLALMHKDAHFIELVPGYLNESRAALRSIG